MRLTKEMADALKVRICGMAWAYDLAQVEAGTRESLISIRHIVTTLDSLVETEQLLTREDGDLLIMELDQHAVTDDGKYIREVAVDIIEHFIEQEPPDLFPDSRCEEDMSVKPSDSKPSIRRIPRDGKERHNVLHDCDTCGYGFGNGICGAPEELGNCRDHSLWIPIVKRSAPKPIDWQPGKDEI